jgi:hypothetical protein
LAIIGIERLALVLAGLKHELGAGWMLRKSERAETAQDPCGERQQERPWLQ